MLETVKRILIPSSLIILLTFVIVEGLILYHGHSPYMGSADYVIILGARLYGEIPSPSLRERLDSALTYLEGHPASKVIVTGGQGPGETITEASAMKRYLQEEGIAEDRIIIEEESTNTFENIRNSLQKIVEIGDVENLEALSAHEVVLVTNNFHVLRGKIIAKKFDISAQGIGAKTPPSVVFQYHIREFFGIFKSIFLDN